MGWGRVKAGLRVLGVSVNSNVALLLGFNPAHPGSD